MSEFGRVTVTIKLGQLSYIMTDFQSEQLDYDMSGDRTYDLKHRSTLTIPLRHRSFHSYILSPYNIKCVILRIDVPYLRIEPIFQVSRVLINSRQRDITLTPA